jgi:hypothetical protein
MDGQRHSSSRRRKSKRSRTENKPNGHNKGQAREEPILIAARRPNAPSAHPTRRFIAASGVPRNGDGAREKSAEQLAANGIAAGSELDAAREDVGRQRGDRPSARNDDSGRHRAARIVQVQAAGPDDREKLRLKLIDRLLHSEGRVAITRAARELLEAGFEFPIAQDVQLQLLEHFDEGCAHQAICHLTELLNEEAPIKRPLFEQRLRRLEEFADDAETRQAAADLRRTVRA